MSDAAAPRALTLAQKILARRAFGPLPPGGLRPGAQLTVAVDWILASELAMAGMAETFARLGHPRLADPSRFFLAIDHTVDPHTIATDPRTQQLVRLSRDFAAAHRIAAFYDANRTIMHTAFYRNHALPGTLVVGADSHTTSHGAVGALAFGLGGADVAVAAVTGRTWLTLPEELRVDLTGRPPFGLTGKDVALRVLAAIGCNRLALERGVEFRTDPAAPLSVDARFTLANMTAELGGIWGIFAATPETAAFLDRFGRPAPDRPLSADPDADYAAQVAVDLAALAPQVAPPFAPDTGRPVDEVIGQPLDGAFIGACTTTEEELILAGLVLEAMLAAGLTPEGQGRRLAIPGDTGIRARLEATGLAETYRRAGFRLGVPGCHMCLGLGSERAGAGEVWLTSQNRNFRNRMGAGSLAWLAAAPTVAASALGMRIADPRPWLARLDRDRLARLLAPVRAAPALVTAPDPLPPAPPSPARLPDRPARAAAPAAAAAPPAGGGSLGPVRGRALVFGDHVDTDAIIPGAFCTLTDPAALGRHAFHHVRPGVPDLVAQGLDIIVAGAGWGCGSSREHAAWALKGAGIRLVLARSLAAIHRRNLVNEGIPALVAPDPDFHALVAEGDGLAVDPAGAAVTHLPSGRRFALVPLGAPEAAILAAGGLIAQVRAAQALTEA